MKLKYFPAIFAALFAVSAYAGSSDYPSGGNQPSQNGATNDMDSTSPNKSLPTDPTQERGSRNYERRSSPSNSGYNSGPTYRSAPSGTNRGTEGPGSGSHNQE